MGNKFSTAYIVLNETNTLKNLIQYDPIELSNNMQKLILKYGIIIDIFLDLLDLFFYF